MFGRFLELSLSTPDIAASLHFYEQLGFSQLPCSDSWTHPYCALSDGQITLGLHQRAAPAAALCFVHADLARHATQLTAAGFEIIWQALGEDRFHELRLRDPEQRELVLLEARTFSPAPVRADASRCGTLLAWSQPARQAEVSAEFWERGGLVAFESQPLPWPHRPLVADGLNLALHDPALLTQPALVYGATDLPQRLAALTTAGLAPQMRSPLTTALPQAALLRAPEGTLLLLLPE